MDAPESVDGVAQMPLHGASLAATFDDANAPSPRTEQYFEVQGSRAMYLDGWKATTDHVGQAHGDEVALMEGSRSFTDDSWALFNLDEDFSEAHDLAAEHPQKLAELESAWWAAAERYGVLPLDDGYMGRMPAIYPPAYPPPAQVRYRPGAGRVADEVMPVLVRGFTIDAAVSVCPGGAEGIVWAMGDWTSGLALYGLDGSLVLGLCLSGDQFRLATPPIPADTSNLGCRYQPASAASCLIELLVDGEVAARLELDRTLPNSWQNGGTGLIIGCDTGFPVNDEYTPPFPWTGTIAHIDIATPTAAPPDPAQITRESLNAD